MATLLDLFKSSDKDTQYDSDQNRLQQELNGIRTTEFLPQLPNIYGTEIIRITSQESSLVQEMKSSRGSEGTNNGLVGEGLRRITGGRIDSLNEAERFIGNKLGIPRALTPTRVVATGKLEQDNTADRMITLAKIRKDGGGTIIGQALKETGGGTPKQIASQGLGIAIDRTKTAIRGKIFGTGTPLDDNSINDMVTTERIIPITTNKNKYSELRPEMLETIYDKENVTPFGEPLRLSPYKIVQKRSANRRGERAEEYYTEEEFKSKTEILKGKSGNSRTLLFSKAENNDERKFTLDAIIIKIGDIRFNLATITGLNETFSPSWDSSHMIGSPFSHYTYTSIERTLSFDLKIYSMNPEEHKENWSKLEQLSRLTYPLAFASTTGFITPPITNLTIGSMYKNKFGFLSSLSYSVDDEGGWELGFGEEVNNIPVTEENLLNRPREVQPNGTSIRSTPVTTSSTLNYADGEWKLPKLIDVSIGFTFIENRQDVESNSLYGFEPIT